MRTPPLIQRLDAHLANQIAAGEVVERPAAVVKELIENSLDAGATRIEVRIADGGRRLIEVSDDGHGMRPDDLRLAIDRHATSKLSSSADLFRIATLGFRGEALPSIAAVSEMELASRAHDASQGARLVVVAGQEQRFEPVGMAPGTRISVRNLFWNVPARLKFLKSEASETGHVTDWVLRLAIGHPQVAFRLLSDEREVCNLPATTDLGARIRQAYGNEAADDLIAVAALSGDPPTAQLSGFIGHPRTARPTGKRQVMILNGRYVKDRILIAAIREGYAGFLEPRLHPSVFLALDIDPALVDVNVHPAKAEVRFVREGEMFALIRNALQNALGAHRGGFSMLGSAPSTSSSASAIVRREVVRPLPAEPTPTAPIYQERFLPVTPAVETAARVADTQRPAEPARPADSQRSAEPERAYQVLSAAAHPAAMLRLPSGVRRVVQLNDAVLLIETAAGIRLVDQHALHEKALLAVLSDQATRLDLGGMQQRLVPLLVSLSAGEVAAIVPMLPALQELGIVAQREGATQLAITGHPPRLGRLDWTGFFTDVAAEGMGAVVSLRERIAHRLVCRAAIKAGQRLTADEQLELVDLLYRVEGLEHCPHGRPTTLDLTWDELNRRFQR